ncbi:bacterial alpha-L-rhamnosidase-domain-containing protein [Ilyonectria robusta]|uniref:bacterial alpha-L-rhamnosidase-domain-containing protein n=1 Tax=Ilyonectria robusta TaxID=1079257 RepID=UPI001E8D8460|nr:bacterial alpha-L-rhamnosidase-domain-containing protein [Ilyonectria robusta]KAH8669425.1 bacterial alpha-L-rhamnosidase-domain-containing protein [Ilyonectria robusta]
MATTIVDVRFEHYQPINALGVNETNPRISWRFENAPLDFDQEEYQLELKQLTNHGFTELGSVRVVASDSQLVPWPYDKPLESRKRYSVVVRARGKGLSDFTPWSEPSILEVGLLSRDDWSSQLISAPWAESKEEPQPEDLFRKEFDAKKDVSSARLYISAHGVYEAEINGQKVGDHFLAPGWTSYAGRLQYQTYDVTKHISQRNCLGIRVAEGWFNGRFGFEGGRRNIWGVRNAAFAQLEMTYGDGSSQIICTDDSWLVTQGPIRLAELYNGEKYDATMEVDGWSSPGTNTQQWRSVNVEPLSDSVELTSGFAEPVRRLETIRPIEQMQSPSGKLILDFGQNLVGYVRLKQLSGPKGHRVILSHAEVLEKGELCTRTLRICDAQDVYTCKGDEAGESFEPRFTFHGFRYLQVDNWPQPESSLLDSVEAVVCNSDMESAGSFECSNPMLNQLFRNIQWGMRGNFFHVPTDCPQRDERLGYSGDLALFAPTAVMLYKCFPFLKNWLVDVAFDQHVLGGTPPVVSPNALLGDPVWGKVMPLAIWHDVVILAPWDLWQETGDVDILERQYASMATWIRKIPRNETGHIHLWDMSSFQLADWLDPNAPPENPQKALTDPVLVANAFLVRCLDIMVQVARILGRATDQRYFQEQLDAARYEFSDEYISPSGRIVSDSQTAYSLAICFELLTPSQRVHAGARLAEIVSKNSFNIGTGFAGTPFVCEALAQTGHSDVAYKMLLNEECPSWLYPVTMGATTIWERWDSMRPDGSINPGEMTSFNHYAFGAVAAFMFERLVGLRSAAPGWKRSQMRPDIAAGFTWAKAEHATPYGKVFGSWSLTDEQGGTSKLKVNVVVPPTTEMEIVLPGSDGNSVKIVGAGSWAFEILYHK